MRQHRPGVGRIPLLLLLAAAGPPARAQHDFDAQRRAMVDEIAALARQTASETGRPSLDPRVIAVLGRVPRHRFVPVL
jgi:protein-L-isoaspartate(D-aspartate) O-methyltransferase